jgi:hypothetical protein
MPVHHRLARAQLFIWQHARLIDRFLFAYHFGDGPREPVVAALAAYRNPDGGFGNALEPDKRVPHSQPVDVETALHILDAIDALDHPFAAGVCDFLVSITTSEGGVPFSLPSVNTYPHAPWWAAPENPPAAINPTAAITGLLLKAGVRHPWVERASEYCWRTIETTDTTAFHDVMPIVTFLEYTADRARAAQELARLAERVQAAGTVAFDLDAEGYVQKPLAWAPTPTSPLRHMFADDVLRTHLHALAAQQQPDGGWGIAWEPISETVRAEWRGVVTTGALLTLRAYTAAGFTAE